MEKRSQLKRIAIMMLVLSLVFGSSSFLGTSTVSAAVDAEPELLVTEVVPNSSGTGQLFEYVEIYNNTSERIDLNGYQLQYFTSNFSSPANRWNISDKIIEANSAMVLWLKKFDNPNSILEEFNANYEVNLIPEQVFEVRLTTAAQGLADGARRKVGIANADGTLLSSAIINDNVADSGFIDGDNQNKDKSVTYKYAGDTDMEKISNGQQATPGTLTADQASGPQTPINLFGTAGDQTIDLTWDSDDASAIEYNIYYYAAADLNLTITEVQTNNTYHHFDQLNNYAEYVFWVAARNADGALSPATSFIKLMPLADEAAESPAAPTGLVANPGINRIGLSWDANTESNLAGYKVYVDGVLYETLTAEVTEANIGGLVKGQEYALTVSAFNYLDFESAQSSEVSAKPADKSPELLITELVSDTDNFSSFDAFEFFEIYNASEAEINLQGYTLSSGWNHTITDTVIIAPGNTLVFWPRRAEVAPLTLEGFNSYYFSSYLSKYLMEEDVYIIENVGGLVNGGSTVVIEDADGLEVSRATYAAGDVAVGKSTIYSYPKDGSTAMEKIAGQQKSTPRSILTGQVPAKTKEHVQLPQAPANVKAAAGDGTVAISWSPNSETDIFKYNIYMNGELEHAVPASQTSFIAYQLTGNKDYRFEVTAVDQSDNESVKSLVQTATPGHQIITQVERAVNPKDAKYDALWAIHEDGPIIPGLVQDLVPQGVTHYADMDWILSVYYLNDGRPGVISVIDAATDQLIKSVVLYHEDGTPYTGHAGGIVVSEKHAWISSEKFMYQLDLQDFILAEDNEELKFIGSFPVDLQAAFATYADGVLWVGEFYHPTAYPTDTSHHLAGRDGKTYYAWIEGFKLDSETDMVSSDKWNGEASSPALPDYVLAVRDRVQGAAFIEDSIILSTSYGRNVDSILNSYNSPLNDQPHQMVTIGQSSIPLWFLDDQALKDINGEITIVPMSEGLFVRGPYLYVTLESGANYYRYTTTYIMDRMVKINLRLWDQGIVFPEEIPAPVIAAVKLAPGSAEQTTKVTGLQEQVAYKYVKGTEGSLARPNIGDEPSRYTESLTAKTNIKAAAGDHIFIVELDADGKITKWADLTVTAADIKKKNSTTPGTTIDPEITEPKEEDEEVLSTTGKKALNPDEQKAAEQVVAQNAKGWNAVLNQLSPSFEYTPLINNSESVEVLTIPVEGYTKGVPVGVYRLEKDGSLSYVGGKLIGNVIEVQLEEAGKYVVLSYDKTYSDIPNTHWAADAIRTLSAKRVLEGTSATQFSGTKNVTRAEFISMIVRALGLKASGSSSFNDVMSTDWFADSLAAAEEAGLLIGTGNHNAAPNETITREQLVVLLVRAYELKSKMIVSQTGSAPFDDFNSTSKWAQQSLIAAYELGLVKGKHNGTYAPLDTTSRAEAAQAIFNLLDKF